MSSGDAWAKYQVQLGYYNQLDLIRAALVSIRGSLQAADVMFDFSEKDMNSCIETVTNANIVLTSFEPYVTLLSDNLNIISKVSNDISTFVTQIEAAFSKCEGDMEKVQAYMTYLYNYYIAALEDEKYQRTPSFPSYTGEIFEGFGS